VTKREPGILGMYKYGDPVLQIWGQTHGWSCSLKRIIVEKNAKK
jgi:hypothetical protein